MRLFSPLLEEKVCVSADRLFFKEKFTKFVYFAYVIFLQNMVK